MFLALLFSLVPLIEDPEKPVAPDPARVKAAVAELKAAFAATAAGPRLRAIESAAALADAEVVEWIGHGLSDKDPSVQQAAIEALRFNEHKKAVDELITRAKQKAAKEDLPVYATLIRAIGQHGSPVAIDVLNDNPWSTPDAQVLQAKILSLGRIHTKEAVKALCDLMEVAGINKIEPFMKDFRLSLWALTGADQGESRELWLKWYRDNKDKLTIAAAPPAEPKELAKRWRRYWAKADTEEDSKDPPKKRKGDGDK
jgi:hypothetical protein